MGKFQGMDLSYIGGIFCICLKNNLILYDEKYKNFLLKKKKEKKKRKKKKKIGLVR